MKEEHSPKMSIEDLVILGEELSHMKKVWWVFPHWVMWTASVVAGGSLFYFDTFLGRVLALLASAFFAAQVAYRMGVYYGFARGFQEGRRQ